MDAQQLLGRAKHKRADVVKLEFGSSGYARIVDIRVGWGADEFVVHWHEVQAQWNRCLTPIYKNSLAGECRCN
jgi:hypothetical protein